jgi:hypothetical protein
VVEYHEDHTKKKHHRKGRKSSEALLPCTCAFHSGDELLRSRPTTNSDVPLLHVRSLAIKLRRSS